MSQTYTFIVALRQEEEGGYSAVVPGLPGCVSQGETVQEAKDNIAEAIQAYIESLDHTTEQGPDLRDRSLVTHVAVDA